MEAGDVEADIRVADQSGMGKISESKIKMKESPSRKARECKRSWENGRVNALPAEPAKGHEFTSLAPMYTGQAQWCMPTDTPLGHRGRQTFP